MENSKAAKQGGRAAGDARRAAEKRTGVKVVSPNNFLKNSNIILITNLIKKKAPLLMRGFVN